MVLEILECVYKLSKKLYNTVEEVKANKKRCKRLSDRIRYLVSPLKELYKQKEQEVVYKEALIDLVQVLEEARQFMNTFTRTKTVTNRIQDYCYAKTVKDKFEELNEKLNDLIPALTLGLHVEYRKSVASIFSPGIRKTQDTKDECEDLCDMEQIMIGLGLSALNYIPSTNLKHRKRIKKSSLYDVYTARYRFSTVILKRLRCTLTPSTKELFINDAKKLVLLNSENVARVYGVCVEPKEDSYLIVMEHMEMGNLKKLLLSKIKITHEMRLRMAVEASRGLYFIHCCDMLHRNLNSSKFLVNEEMRVKISGFGFSQHTKSPLSSESAVQVGYKTPVNVAQSNEPYTEAKEIYHFGMIIWQIATRRPISKFPKKTGSAAGTNDELLLECSEITDVKSELLAVSSWCSDDDEFSRPSMEDVLEHLIDYKEKMNEHSTSESE